MASIPFWSAFTEMMCLLTLRLGEFCQRWQFVF